MSDLTQEEAEQRALEWLDFECERDYFGQRDAINLRKLIERLRVESSAYRSGMDINAEQTKKTPDIDWGKP